MTIVNAETGELIAECSTSEARHLTDQIKTAVGATWELIKQAYTSRAWAALGYGSWDDYCTQEFGNARLRLPREDRQEAVASLREAGLSIRAIAAATGESKSSVDRALSGVPNGTPDEDDHGDEPAVITGTDGKTYKASASTTFEEADVAPVPGTQSATSLRGPRLPKPRAGQFDKALHSLGGMTIAFESVNPDDLSLDAEKAAAVCDDLTSAIRSLTNLRKRIKEKYL